MIEKIRDSQLEKERTHFIYVGDGKGDYCPSLELRKEDIVMPRKDYPLWRLIHGDVNAIEAEIHEWIDHSELGKSLLQQLGIEPDSSSVDSVDAQKLVSANNNTTGVMSCQLVVSRI